MAARTMLLCGVCRRQIGRQAPEGLQLHQRQGKELFRPDPDQPPTGEHRVYCRGCDTEGVIDVGSVMRKVGDGRRTLLVRLRRVYG